MPMRKKDTRDGYHQRLVVNKEEEKKKKRADSREKNKKKEEEENMDAFLVTKERRTQFVFIRNREEKRRKPTLKPRFMMNPTTMMVDKGNDAKDEDEVIKPLQQTNKSHEDSSGDGGTNPAGIWFN
ncbi:hypothetical protein Tco_0678577 [Tanacetum coccineum]|uniref:Uncharacterized protein n=1 Tax=Tanacetum coccineum TaxID=301880 RepID=A0ABQ4XGE0_9ASTR